MVKLRDARYCNLKLLLIYLVIYGHLIEPQIGSSQVVMSQYRWIYLFHMPLFCFLSGLFLKDSKACRNQFKKTFPLYILLQAAAFLFGNGKVRLFTPYWHLWYLLSCSTWTGIGWLWYRFCKRKGKLLVLILAIVFGCAAGFDANIGRAHSLSRTIVFFPYFWAGLMLDQRYPWQKLRVPGLIALVAAVSLMLTWGKTISAPFLYQAVPYGPVRSGAALRLLCYAEGFLLCMFLLAFIPAKRFPFSRAGANTLPAYLAHAPLVLYLRKQAIPWPAQLLTAALILYFVYKLSQWFRSMYGIIPSERRDRWWPRSKRSMKNTPSRYIGSSCR